MLRLIARLFGRKEEEQGAAHQKESDQDERRIWSRHESSATTHVKRLTGGEERIDAIVRNVSRGGVNFLVDRHIQPGEMLDVEIAGDSQGNQASVLACIVHCQELDQGQWALGCTFAEELSDEDLQGLGAKKERASTSDNRTWVRYVCNVKASYGLAEEEEEDLESAQVVNISAGGVGLLVQREIRNGTLLNLKLESEKREESRMLLACVVHVVAHPTSTWSLGCNFIRELSPSDLKALL